MFYKLRTTWIMSVIQPPQCCFSAEDFQSADLGWSPSNYNEVILLYRPPRPLWISSYLAVGVTSKKPKLFFQRGPSSTCKNPLHEGRILCGLKQERCVFSSWLTPPGELPGSSQDAVRQRGEVVAWIEDVGFTALAFLQPHDIRAGREEGTRALPVEL